MTPKRPSVAVIGSGISGLTAAYRLHADHDVTVFESADWVGGHTHTLDITIEGRTTAVDTGFIVCNNWTYPRFLGLLDELGVKTQPTDMSFSVHCLETGLQYAGNNLSTLFAQRKNLLSPAHYRFLLDIVRFNREAIRDFRDASLDPAMSLGQYLEAGHFGPRLTRFYLYPMASAIWSSDLDCIEDMPALFFIRFFHNHGLLNLINRPQWFTLPGGSRQYIAPLTRGFADQIHLATPVTQLTETATGILVHSAQGARSFDGVVLATHSDQALTLWPEAPVHTKAVLRAIPYTENDVILHQDKRQMPANSRAHASWNYRLGQSSSPRAVVTYDMNRLQCLTGPDAFFVTLNNTPAIDPSTILARYQYAHPEFGPGSLDAQSQIATLNTNARIVLAGAWCRHGFHEDGVVSGEAAAAALSTTLARTCNLAA